MHYMYAGAHGGQKRAPVLLGLEFQVVVRQHGNQTQVFRRTKESKSLSRVSSPGLETVTHPFHDMLCIAGCGDRRPFSRKGSLPGSRRNLSSVPGTYLMEGEDRLPQVDL